MNSVEQRIRHLKVAFERLDAAWRREHSLTANEELVITFLSADGPLSPTQIAGLVGITSAGISTLIDRLETGGYVLRRPHPDDGRRVLVTLTKRSVQARMGYESVTSEIARHAPPEDTDRIERFLDVAASITLQRAGYDGLGDQRD